MIKQEDMFEWAISKTRTLVNEFAQEFPEDQGGDMSFCAYAIFVYIGGAIKAVEGEDRLREHFNIILNAPDDENH